MILLNLRKFGYFSDVVSGMEGPVARRRVSHRSLGGDQLSTICKEILNSVEVKSQRGSSTHHEENVVTNGSSDDHVEISLEQDIVNLKNVNILLLKRTDKLEEIIDKEKLRRKCLENILQSNINYLNIGSNDIDACSMERNDDGDIEALKKELMDSKDTIDDLNSRILEKNNIIMDLENKLKECKENLAELSLSGIRMSKVLSLPNDYFDNANESISSEDISNDRDISIIRMQLSNIVKRINELAAKGSECKHVSELLLDFISTANTELELTTNILRDYSKSLEETDSRYRMLKASVDEKEAKKYKILQDLASLQSEERELEKYYDVLTEEIVELLTKVDDLSLKNRMTRNMFGEACVLKNEVEAQLNVLDDKLSKFNTIDEAVHLLKDRLAKIESLKQKCREGTIVLNNEYDSNMNKYKSIVGEKADEYDAEILSSNTDAPDQRQNDEELSMQVSNENVKHSGLQNQLIAAKSEPCDLGLDISNKSKMEGDESPLLHSEEDDGQRKEEELSILEENCQQTEVGRETSSIMNSDNSEYQDNIAKDSNEFSSNDMHSRKLYETFMEQYQALVKRVEEESGSNSSILESITTTMDSIKVLSEKLSDLESEYINKKEELEVCTSRVDDIQSKITQKMNEIESLGVKTEEISKQKESLDNEYESMVEKLNCSKQKNVEITQLIEIRREDIKRISCELSSVESEYSDLESRLEKKNLEISNITELINEKNRMLEELGDSHKKNTSHDQSQDNDDMAFDHQNSANMMSEDLNEKGSPDSNTEKLVNLDKRHTDDIQEKADVTCKELREITRDLESGSKIGNMLNEKLEELSRHFNEALIAKDNISAEIVEKQGNIKGLEAELSKIRGECISSKSLLEKYNNEILQLIENIKTKTDELEGLSCEVDNSNKLSTSPEVHPVESDNGLKKCRESDHNQILENESKDEDSLINKIISNGDLDVIGNKTQLPNEDYISQKTPSKKIEGYAPANTDEPSRIVEEIGLSKGNDENENEKFENLNIPKEQRANMYSRLKELFDSKCMEHGELSKLVLSQVEEISNLNSVINDKELEIRCIQQDIDSNTDTIKLLTTKKDLLDEVLLSIKQEEQIADKTLDLQGQIDHIKRFICYEKVKLNDAYNNLEKVRLEGARESVDLLDVLTELRQAQLRCEQLIFVTKS